MLAITLKPGEYVQIGDNITIYNREDHQIRMAIEAPREIGITRSDAKIVGPKE